MTKRSSKKRTSKRGGRVQPNYFFFPETEETGDPKQRALRIFDESLDAAKQVIAGLKPDGRASARSIVDSFYQAVMKYEMATSLVRQSGLHGDGDISKRLRMVHDRGGEAQEAMVGALQGALGRKPGFAP
jgi:hypothetical protein